MKMLSRVSWKLLARGVVSIGLLGWFVFSFNWNEILRALTGIDPTWLLIAVVWIIVSVVVSTVKWQIILQAQGLNLRFGELWQIYWAGLFFNNFLPSSIGGDALRIMWAGKAADDNPGATASVIVERILATVGLAIVGLLGSLLVPGSNKEITMLFFALILISFAILTLLIVGKLPWKWRKQNKAAVFLNGLLVHGQKIRKSPKTILVVICWSIVFQLCVVAVNYAIFRSLHFSVVSWVDAMFVIPATSVAAMLPLGINGYGIREGSYVAMLAPYGVSAVSAFASSIIFAFLISICSLWGGWVWLSRNPNKDMQIHKNERSFVNEQSTQF
jgi:glycosyltransferase 2 family protein